MNSNTSLITVKVITVSTSRTMQCIELVGYLKISQTLAKDEQFQPGWHSKEKQSINLKLESTQDNGEIRVNLLSNLA